MWVNCADCGAPCGLLSTGWYRCRQCGYESLRDCECYDRGERAYVLASLACEPMESDERGEAAPALGLSLLSTRQKTDERH